MLFGITSPLFCFLTGLLGLFLGGIPALYFIAYKKRILLGIISIVVCCALSVFVHFAVAIAVAVIFFFIAVKIPEHDPSAKAAQEIRANIENLENEMHSGISPSKRSWKCPECGSTNQSFMDTCGCGTKRP